MTVLHIIEPFAGGVITFLTHLTRETPGHQHTVLHGSRTTADKLEQVRQRFESQVNFVEWRFVEREIKPISDLRAYWFLFRFLKKNKFDVIHLHSAKAGFLGRLACFFLGIHHVVYTAHAAPFLRRDVRPVTKHLYVLLEKFSAFLGGTTVCCCPSELRAYEHIGMKAVCINNGTPVFDVKKKLVPDKTVIICSGFLNRQKNPRLFNSIARQFLQYSDVEFIWIGDGPLRNEVTSPNITVTGWLSSTEVYRYYQSADIYLSGSAWEGLPYGVLEAMNAECCLLLSACDGHTDMVESGKNGFLFSSPDEAAKYLQSILNDKTRQLRMGKTSRDICRAKFNVTSMATQYNDLYLSKQE